ncbi:MAG: FAD:protein FMN transferase [Candidatus Anammoxibacter sp.]
MNHKLFVTNLMILCFVIHFFAGKAITGELTGTASAGNELKLHKKTVYTMGSLMDISIYEKDDEKVNRVIEMAFDEVKRLDKLMSNYKRDSELSRINMEAVNGYTACDSELLDLIEQSIQYSRKTNGAFDITVYPLVNLWGFYGNSVGKITGYMPNESELQAILPAVSYKNIKILHIVSTDSKEGSLSFKNKKTQIDLGAIGKGYAVDKVVEVFRNEGIKSALVNFSGNIYALGVPPERESWAIGLKDPFDAGNDVMGSFKIRDKAVATSGDYERFFVRDNIKYSHIIDPRTGRPVSGMLSVTIVCETATMADALSTGVFVLGHEKGIELIERLDGVEGIIIFENRESKISIKISTGFKDILEINKTEGRWTIFDVE